MASASYLVQTAARYHDEVNLRIALDGQGSDSYPVPEIEGAVLAAREFACEIILTGDEDLLRPAIDKLRDMAVADRLSILHAPQRVAMDESPAFASRRRSENSISVGMQLVRDGKADAFVTAGNTGAALANGLLILGRINGAKRPALTAVIPVRSGNCVMLDIGANAECKPEYLFQFGVMGSVYSEKVLGVSSPRVGLLSTGEEASKGNTLTQQAYTMLSESGALNFVGNIEGKELFAGAADVVVTDGFTGNITIKVAEAVAGMVGVKIKEAFRSNPLAMIGGTLASTAIRRAAKQLDPNEYGGAPLLGVDGIAVVAHGRSNGLAMKSAINVARMAVAQDMVSEIREGLSNRLTMSDGANY